MLTLFSGILGYRQLGTYHASPGRDPHLGWRTLAVAALKDDVGELGGFWST